MCHPDGIRLASAGAGELLAVQFSERRASSGQTRDACRRGDGTNLAGLVHTGSQLCTDERRAASCRR
jgi:hypothetical protein